MGFSPAELAASLKRLLPDGATGLVLAVSGGLDSSCLAAAAAAGASLPLRAVHVDHGLQPCAAAFREHCVALCARLGLDLHVVTVAVPLAPGTSVEAAARDARYRALAAELRPGECLLSAHHLEDQAETFLLQALRGAGPRGLAGMPERRVLGAGWHLRPLLAVPRAALGEFAAQHALTTIEDPMNHDRRYDRSFLRAEVWPGLVAHWPGAATGLARAAQHSAEAQDLLDALADEDLAVLRDGAALSVQRLRRLPRGRQNNALRRWIQGTGATPPSTARLTEALRQMLGSRADHVPEVRWAGHALRGYRQRIYIAAAAMPRLVRDFDWHWRVHPECALGAGLGRLRIVEQPGGLALGAADAVLRVRARHGGERLRAAPGGRTQSVQHLCQARGILPWVRDALPFIYRGEKLVAVGDLWSSADRTDRTPGIGIGFRWEDAPDLH